MLASLGNTHWDFSEALLLRFEKQVNARIQDLQANLMGIIFTILPFPLH
jgi:hypothetical protein